MGMLHHEICATIIPTNFTCKEKYPSKYPVHIPFIIAKRLPDCEFLSFDPSNCRYLKIN
jgi:hypothetical protein